MGAMEYEESLGETAIRELLEQCSLVEECCLTCCSTIGPDYGIDTFE
ncbi:hypothetical protein ACIQYL_04310 [Lysinibacillus xylanilyticus]